MQVDTYNAHTAITAMNSKKYIERGNWYLSYFRANSTDKSDGKMNLVDNDGPKSIKTILHELAQDIASMLSSKNFNFGFARYSCRSSFCAVWHDCKQWCTLSGNWKWEEMEDFGYRGFKPRLGIFFSFFSGSFQKSILFSMRN